MRSVLVTGAAGFLGRHLINHLRSIGDDVVPTSRNGAVGHAIDLSDARAVVGILRQVRPSSIIHLAARVQGEPAELVSANVTATAVLLDAVRAECPDAPVVITGSAAEYGPKDARVLPVTEADACAPVGMHAVTKHAATLLALEYARAFSLNIAVARLFNVLGPGQPSFTVLGNVLIQTLEAKKTGRAALVTLGRLDSVRDFVTCADVVGALASLRGRAPGGEIVNICSGVPRSVRSVVERFVDLAPIQVELKIGDRDAHSAEPPAMVGSWEKAHRLIGFTPTTDLEPVMREMWSVAT